MNLVLLSSEDFVADDRVRLRGRRAQYVAGVHRAAVGETLRVGLLGGRVGSGVIERLTADELELEVRLDAEPPPKLPLTLVLALPRPKVLGRLLQAIAAMGVPRLHLMHAWRVEKSFWESPALQPENLQRQLRLGLEQGRDTIEPEVTLHPLFKPMVEDRLPSIAAGTLALVAHPAAAAVCPRAVEGAVTLAIGPEGGFIAYEVESLERQGFAAVSLGPRILRVEQAVPALIARLF